MTSFIPHTADERQQMLDRIGVSSVDALFDAVPASLKHPFTLNTLPKNGRSELELQHYLTAMASQNPGAGMLSFMGGGAYARFIPPAVNAIASRSEFYTAYTPYQPEISQGTLQMIYEFQTMMSELTGMDVTNASVYDGATAMSEAAFMAVRATRRKVLYVSKTTNPQYQQVLRTYCHAFGDMALGWFDPDQPLGPQFTHEPNTIAAILVQQPDYYGTIRPLSAYQEAAKATGALLVVAVDPMTLALLDSPRKAGADIVCGDIQQFGNSVNFGGPYGGFLSTTEKLMRQLPGRVVGRTVDKEGTTAYTLTLQTREQHIRREKATSNICTNQSLNVLKATAYLSLLGPQGLHRIASVSAERAHELAKGLLAVPEVSLRSGDAYLYEFAVRLPIPAKTMVHQMAHQYGILAGIDLGKYWPEEDHTLLIAVTELNTPESLERYLSAFRDVIHNRGLSVLPSGMSRDVKMVATGTRGGQ